MEKEEILKKLRTLYSQHDSQLPVAGRLKDKDSFVVHDSEGTEKKISVKQMAKAMASVLWEKDITYTVSCNTNNATITIAENGGEATEIQTFSGAPGTHLTITVAADGYHTEVFDVIACYDYTLYVTLYQEATCTFTIVNDSNNQISSAKLYYRKDSVGPWKELSVTETDDSSDSGETTTYSYVLSGHSGDTIYYKAVAPGYEWSTEGSVTLSESSNTQEITLEETKLSVSLESEVDFSYAGGKNAILIETKGEPVGVTISVPDDTTWLRARYDEMFIRDKGRCVIVAAANTTSEERTCTITVKQAITGTEYSVTATQKYLTEE